MNARDLLAAAHIGSGIRQGAMPPDEYVFVKDPPEIFCKADSRKSPQEMHARAALIVAAVNEYEPHLELEAVAGDARDALAAIVVMLGTGSGDPMGTSRRHFEALDEVLARLDAVRSDT